MLKLLGLSFSDLAASWVHPSVETKSEAYLGHARFIGSHLVGGCIALIAIPVYLAINTTISVVEVSLLALLSLPVLWAFFVSKTGWMKLGVAGSLTTVAVMIAVASVFFGGLSSPFIFLLFMVPIEAALSQGKRGIVYGLAIAALALASIMYAPILSAPFTLAVPAQVLTSIVAMVYSIVLALRLSANHAKTSEELLAEQDRFRLLADNATDLITRHDQYGSTLFASPAARPLFGTSASNLLSSGLFEKIHLQDRVIFLKSISSAVHNGKSQSCQFRIRCKGSADQVWKWVEMRCRPLRDEKTGRTDVVSVTRDITTAKEQAITLREATEKSEEANQAQRRFLATMSHELRTPLNAILGFSDVLNQELFGELPHERHKEYVGLIHDSGQHLLNVVNDLLDISRIEAGKYELSISPFNVIDIADATIKMLQPMAANAEVTVHCDVLPTLPVLTADKRSCQQILINLVSNAIKFTPEGGSVKVSAKQHGRALKLRVKDNGIGIDESFIPSIGQPFMQADMGHDRSYEGSGLGLSVVKGLVALHGGEFDIQSTKGKGTAVTVTLPLNTQITRLVPADEEAQLVHLNTKPVHESINKSKSTVTSRKGDSRARVSA
ncbi:MAG: PAS domain-containing sensor histidine kinase [Rhizobiaceae bacterium]